MTHDATRVDTTASSSHEHPGTTEGRDSGEELLDEGRVRGQRMVTASLLRLVIADANRLADGVAKLLRVVEGDEAADGSHEQKRIGELAANLSATMNAAAKLLPLPTIAYREDPPSTTADSPVSRVVTP